MSLSPLNVVHVASGDLWAGAEVQLYYLARALRARREVRLRVIVLNHGELERRLRTSGVPVEVLDETSLSPFQLVRQLRKRLQQSGAQVVHSHRYKENMLASLAAHGTGCMAVRSIHSMPEPPRGLRGRAVRFADTQSARWQQAGVCVSPELMEGMQKRLPGLPLEVIENGIDFAELERTAREPVDESLFGQGLRVAFVARLVHVKRPDLFVAAAHHLAGRMPGHFSFHIFGDGPMEGPCRDFVARHHLEGDVRLLGFRSNMPAWLARCDLLLLCSDHEGLPMVLLEAMGLGVPVIAHAVGGIPHVLHTGEYGILVRDHTPDGYADAIREVAATRQATLKRAGLACRHARDNYAIEVTVDRYLALYRRVLGPGVSATPLVHSEKIS